MKLTVKICLLLFCFFLFRSVSFAGDSSEKSTILKNIVLKKVEIQKKMDSWGKYIVALDSYLDKKSSQTQEIKSLLEKLKRTKGKLWNSKKHRDLKLIIEYIEFKGRLILLSSENTIDISLMEEKQAIEHLDTLPLKELESVAQNALKKYENTDAISLHDIENKIRRDEQRIKEIRLIKNAIEQVYANYAEYPTQDVFKKRVWEFLDITPSYIHPKATNNNCSYDYTYQVGPDKYGIQNGDYRLSVCLEHKNHAVFNIDLSWESSKIVYGNKDIDSQYESFHLHDIYNKKQAHNHLDMNEDESRLFYYDRLRPYFKKDGVDNTSNSAVSKNEVSWELRLIASKIEIYITENGGESTPDILWENYSELAWNSTKPGATIQWTVNYSVLWLNKDDTSDVNGTPYTFAYIQLGDTFYYQVLWYADNGDGMRYVTLRWNYIKDHEAAPESLFYDTDTQKPLFDRDVIK